MKRFDVRRAGRGRATRTRALICVVLAATAVLEPGCIYTNAVFNHTRSALFSRKKQNEFVFHPTFVVEDPEFFRSLGIIGEGMIAGNDVALLENGDRIFPAMVADIRTAERSVNMETFIFEDDRAGRMVADALIEAARRGVGAADGRCLGRESGRDRGSDASVNRTPIGRVLALDNCASMLRICVGASASLKSKRVGGSSR